MSASDDVTSRERRISGALALGMHVLFIVLLVVGVSWQSKRTSAPIAVELWSELPPPAPRAKPEPPPPPPPAPPEPLKQAPRPPPRPPEPKPEAKPVPKPDIALKEQLVKKKQEEEKRRAELEEKEREQKEREQKLAKEKAEKERKELEARKRKEQELAEQKKREEAKRLAEQKKQEEARKLAELRRQEDAKRREQELQDMLRRQAQQAAEAEARSRLDAYSRLVADRIKRYIVEPPNLKGTPEAVFEVVQIPGGEILSVRLKRSSGNPAYDAAAERAIRKAQPLPPPPDPARFSEVRELELKVRPEGR